MTVQQGTSVTSSQEKMLKRQNCVYRIPHKAIPHKPRGFANGMGIRAKFALATETNNMRYGDYEEEEDDVLFNRSVIASVCAGASCGVKQRL